MNVGVNLKEQKTIKVIILMQVNHVRLKIRAIGGSPGELSEEFVTMRSERSVKE